MCPGRGGEGSSPLPGGLTLPLGWDRLGRAPRPLSSFPVPRLFLLRISCLGNHFTLLSSHLELGSSSDPEELRQGFLRVQPHFIVVETVPVPLINHSSALDKPQLSEPHRTRASSSFAHKARSSHAVQVRGLPCSVPEQTLLSTACMVLPFCRRGD